MPAPRRVWTGAETRVPGVMMFGHYEYLAAQTGLPQHQHRGALEICFLVRGEQTYRVSDAVYRLRGGDQFVTLPDEPHDTAGEPEQKGELFWVILQTRPLPPGFLHLPAGLGHGLTGELLRLPQRRFRASPDAGDFLARFELALSGGPPGWRGDLEAASALHQYLLATLRAAHAETTAEPSPGARVRAAMDWFEAHLDEPARLCEVAAAVGWSEAHFKAAFRRETGLTPHDYFLRRKMAKARHWLAHGGRSVTDVAMSLGFSSSQHFAVMFRRFVGHPPSAHGPDREMNPSLP